MVNKTHHSKDGGKPDKHHNKGKSEVVHSTTSSNILSPQPTHVPSHTLSKRRSTKKKSHDQPLHVVGVSVPVPAENLSDDHYKADKKHSRHSHKHSHSHDHDKHKKLSDKDRPMISVFAAEDNDADDFQDEMSTQKTKNDTVGVRGNSSFLSILLRPKGNGPRESVASVAESVSVIVGGNNMQSSLINAVPSLINIPSSQTISRYSSFSAFGSSKDEETDEEEKEDDIRNRNTWSIESFEPTEDREFQHEYLNSMELYYLTFVGLGREPHSISWKKDGSPVFQFKFRSLQAIWCIIFSVLNFLLCGWVWLSTILFFSELPSGKGETPKYWRYVRSHELILLKRNMTTFVIFHACILHLFIVHVLVFTKQEFMCKYLTLWIESIELLRLHCVIGLHSYIRRKLLIFFIGFIFLGVIFSISAFQICRGTGALLGVVLLRMFDPEIVMLEKENFHLIRAFGSALFIFVFFLAKLSAIQFACRCRMINQLIKVWNRRFKVCMLGTYEEQKNMIRSSRAILFKDHIVWFNILEGANTEMFLQIESFFLMVCISFIYETNHVVRTFTGNEFDSNRSVDFGPVILFMIIDLYAFYTAGIEAGKINETATGCFDVVREKGVLTKKADQELWFMLSLQLSLMGSHDELGMGVVGWEFVYYSKTFMLVALGVSFSFFVMQWQYQQPIDQYLGNDPYCDRVNVSDFLDRVLDPHLFFPDVPTHLSACHDDYTE